MEEGATEEKSSESVLSGMESTQDTQEATTTASATSKTSNIPENSDFPPSPLTGAYLLIVIGQPFTHSHKDAIMQKLAKGFLSWDATESCIDIEKELSAITAIWPEGDLDKSGERLIQFASDRMITEILINPQTLTMKQCVRNMLSSFSKYRFLVHAGYAFAGNGSWILQDGTFSISDFAEAFHELEVERVIQSYAKTIKTDICCMAEGDWTTKRISQESFSRLCTVEVNPHEKMIAAQENITVKQFLSYLEEFIIPASIEELLKPSDVVGNIRFTHPTIYIFPGGDGDAALFGINGFNMLVDGGFDKNACFWNFVRHLDRLDAVLFSRLNNTNMGGMSAIVERKVISPIYPQIGHFFGNLQMRKSIQSPDGDKDKDPLLVNLIEENDKLVFNLRQLSLKPHLCYRDSSNMEPINLYNKVGHGQLDMYVISPAKDSREVKEFLSKWNTGDSKLFGEKARIGNRELSIPLQNLVSICALIVWQPTDRNASIIRILFPGSTPQHKIFEGLEKFKQVEFLKHATCSAKSLSPNPKRTPLKSKSTIITDYDNKKLKEKASPPVEKIQTDMAHKIQTSQTASPTMKPKMRSTENQYKEIKAKVDSNKETGRKIINKKEGALKKEAKEQKNVNMEQKQVKQSPKKLSSVYKKSGPDDAKTRPIPIKPRLFKPETENVQMSTEKVSVDEKAEMQEKSTDEESHEKTESMKETNNVEKDDEEIIDDQQKIEEEIKNKKLEAKEKSTITSTKPQDKVEKSIKKKIIADIVKPTKSQIKNKIEATDTVKSIKTTIAGKKEPDVITIMKPSALSISKPITVSKPKLQIAPMKTLPAAKSIKDENNRKVVESRKPALKTSTIQSVKNRTIYNKNEKLTKEDPSQPKPVKRPVISNKDDKKHTKISADVEKPITDLSNVSMNLEADAANECRYEKETDKNKEEAPATYISSIISTGSDDILVVEKTELQQIDMDQVEYKYLVYQKESEKKKLPEATDNEIKYSVQEFEPPNLNDEDKIICEEVDEIIKTATEMVTIENFDSIENIEDKELLQINKKDESVKTTASSMLEDETADIEEKYDKEETKERTRDKILANDERMENSDKRPSLKDVQVSLQQQYRLGMKEAVKTPDEVAELPIHEEVDNEYVSGRKISLKPDQPTDLPIATTKEELSLGVIKPDCAEHVMLTPTPSSEENPILGLKHGKHQDNAAEQDPTEIDKNTVGTELNNKIIQIEVIECIKDNTMDSEIKDKKDKYLQEQRIQVDEIKGSNAEEEKKNNQITKEIEGLDIKQTEIQERTQPKTTLGKQSLNYSALKLEENGKLVKEKREVEELEMEQEPKVLFTDEKLDAEQEMVQTEQTGKIDSELGIQTDKSEIKKELNEHHKNELLLNKDFEENLNEKDENEDVKHATEKDQYKEQTGKIDSELVNQTDNGEIRKDSKDNKNELLNKEFEETFNKYDENEDVKHERGKDQYKECKSKDENEKLNVTPTSESEILFEEMNVAEKKISPIILEELETEKLDNDKRKQSVIERTDDSKLRSADENKQKQNTEEIGPHLTEKSVIILDDNEEQHLIDDELKSPITTEPQEPVGNDFCKILPDSLPENEPQIIAHPIVGSITTDEYDDGKEIMPTDRKLSIAIQQEQQEIAAADGVERSICEKIEESTTLQQKGGDLEVQSVVDTTQTSLEEIADVEQKKPSEVSDSAKETTDLKKEQLTILEHKDSKMPFTDILKPTDKQENHTDDISSEKSTSVFDVHTKKQSIPEEPEVSDILHPDTKEKITAPIKIESITPERKGSTTSANKEKITYEEEKHDTDEIIPVLSEKFSLPTDSDKRKLSVSEKIDLKRKESITSESKVQVLEDDAITDLPRKQSDPLRRRDSKIVLDDEVNSNEQKMIEQDISTNLRKQSVSDTSVIKCIDSKNIVTTPETEFATQEQQLKDSTLQFEANENADQKITLSLSQKSPITSDETNKESKVLELKSLSPKKIIKDLNSEILQHPDNKIDSVNFEENKSPTIDIDERKQSIANKENELTTENNQNSAEIIAKTVRKESLSVEQPNDSKILLDDEVDKISYEMLKTQEIPKSEIVINENMEEESILEQSLKFENTDEIKDTQKSDEQGTKIIKDSVNLKGTKSTEKYEHTSDKEGLVGDVIKDEKIEIKSQLKLEQEVQIEVKKEEPTTEKVIISMDNTQPSKVDEKHSPVVNLTTPDLEEIISNSVASEKQGKKPSNIEDEKINNQQKLSHTTQENSSPTEYNVSLQHQLLSPSELESDQPIILTETELVKQQCKLQITKTTTKGYDESVPEKSSKISDESHDLKIKEFTLTDETNQHNIRDSSEKLMGTSAEEEKEEAMKMTENNQQNIENIIYEIEKHEYNIINDKMLQNYEKSETETKEENDIDSREISLRTTCTSTVPKTLPNGDIKRKPEIIQMTAEIEHLVSSEVDKPSRANDEISQSEVENPKIIQMTAEIKHLVSSEVDKPSRANHEIPKSEVETPEIIQMTSEIEHLVSSEVDKPSRTNEEEIFESEMESDEQHIKDDKCIEASVNQENKELAKMTENVRQNKENDSQIQEYECTINEIMFQKSETPESEIEPKEQKEINSKKTLTNDNIKIKPETVKVMAMEVDRSDEQNIKEYIIEISVKEQKDTIKIIENNKQNTETVGQIEEHEYTANEKTLQKCETSKFEIEIREEEIDYTKKSLTSPNGDKKSPEIIQTTVEIQHLGSEVDDDNTSKSEPESIKIIDDKSSHIISERTYPELSLKRSSVEFNIPEILKETENFNDSSDDIKRKFKMESVNEITRNECKLTTKEEKCADEILEQKTVSTDDKNERKPEIKKMEKPEFVYSVQETQLKDHESANVKSHIEELYKKEHTETKKEFVEETELKKEIETLTSVLPNTDTVLSSEEQENRRLSDEHKILHIIETKPADDDLKSPDSALHMDANQMCVKYTMDKVGKYDEENKRKTMISKSHSVDNNNSNNDDGKDMVSKTISLPILDEKPDELCKPTATTDNEKNETLSKSLPIFEDDLKLISSDRKLLKEIVETESKSISLPVIEQPDQSSKYMALPPLHKTETITDLSQPNDRKKSIDKTEHLGMHLTDADLTESEENISEVTDGSDSQIAMGKNNAITVERQTETVLTTGSSKIENLNILKDVSSEHHDLTEPSRKDCDDADTKQSLQLSENSDEKTQEVESSHLSDNEYELTELSDIEEMSEDVKKPDCNEPVSQSGISQKVQITERSAGARQTTTDVSATSAMTVAESVLSATIIIDQTHDQKSDEQKDDPIKDWGKPLGLPSPKKATDNSKNLAWDPIEKWGKPLGLPSLSDQYDKNGGDIEINLTPLNQMETPKNSAKNKKVAAKVRENSRTRESPIKSNNRWSPVYVDLAYVPHHGNPKYTTAEFFKRIRARYYVFSGTDPSREVFNALLDAKKIWEDQNLEVTIITTYETDTLGYWIAENEETLLKLKIDLSPSASRCTINLQEHDTSCSAFRLEF